MRYIMVLFWSILLLEMVNFVLNSLAGGGPLNMILPLVLAVIFTIVVVILDALMKPIKQSAASEDNHH
ncbi:MULTISPECIES: YjzD family protein [Staphylococcus]|uniref:YjzD family protein n=1 Tax=Staphylococcus TaxID=1279 RepID=UPI000D02C611|nr:MULTISPECIES: YjzD family protein [Staphylococcus]MCD8914352.1 YjzD family protein [Staphylococcus simulans]UXV34415.1 YjzD family protein [Staphylococcus sp. IVB6181]